MAKSGHGEREGRIAESHQNEGADSEYATIQERELIATERELIATERNN